MSIYLFVLSPPFSGSTVLWKLLGTSAAVSSLPREGQFISEVKEVMRQDPWNPQMKLPWKKIKEVWEGYWDLGKPVLVEKSPPNIIRMGEIVKHFYPVYLLVIEGYSLQDCKKIRKPSLSFSDAPII